MRINELYHIHESSEVAYSTTPTHMLDVSRLLQNRPFWKMFHGQANQRKKTLVLHADPNKTKWTWRKKVIAAERFHDLQQLGFKIVVFRDNAFQSLEARGFEKPATLFSSTITDDKQIQTLAVKQLMVTPEELLIINDTVFEKILAGDDSDWEKLGTFENCNLSNSNISADSLNRLFAAKGKEIRELDLRGCLNLDSGELDEKNFPTQLTSLKLSFRDRECALFNGQDYDTCDYYTPNEIKLFSLGSRSIDLIKEMVFEARGAQFRVTSLANTPELESLTLRSVIIDAAVLEQHLLKSKKLKKLSLKDCRITGKFNFNIHLENLVHLDLYNSKMHPKTLNALLHCSKQIENLDIRWRRKLMSSRYSIYFEMLPLMKSVYLDGIMLDQKATRDLFDQMQNIQKLCLWRCNLNHLPKTHLNTSQLEYLDLNKTKIDATALTHFLIQAKRLETLDLTRCKKLSFGELQNIDLPALKTLYLYNSNINNAMTKTLIDASPNLQLISLNPNLRNIWSCYRLYKKLQREKKNVEIDNPLSLSFFRNLDLLLENPSFSLKKFKLPSSDSGYLFYNACKIGLSIAIVGIVLYEFDRAFGSSHHDSTRFIDADTRLNENKTLHARKIFFSVNGDDDPDVSMYRLSVFNDIRPVGFNASLDRCTVLGTIHPLEESLNLIDVERNYSRLLSATTSENPHKKEYIGRCKIELSDKWTPLPSLFPNEEILTYYVSDKKLVTEIGYSKQGNLYYIRANNDSAKNVYVEFRLSIPLQPQVNLPSNIQKLVDYCRSFSTGPLKAAAECNTGEAFLNALEQEKVGACRHRTAVFLWRMKKENTTISARIVNNEVHSFVELEVNGQWVTYDLGGYPCNVSVDDAAMDQSDFDMEWMVLAQYSMICMLTGGLIYYAYTKNKSDHHQSDADADAKPSSKRKYFENKHKQDDEKPTDLNSYIKKCIHGHKKTLLKIKNDRDITGFCYQLQKYCLANDIPFFLVTSPDDLICSAPYATATEQNEIEMHQGPGGSLYQFLRLHRHRSLPVIILDYTRFTKSDFVRFNTLLDPNGKSDGVRLPKHTHVIGLMNPDNPNAYLGSDLLSRYDAKETIPFSGAALSIPEFMVNTQKPDDANKTVCIEFYGVKNWKERLVGVCKLAGKKILFEPGALMHAIQNGATKIIFSNAPWDDSEFMHFCLSTFHLKHHFIAFGKTISVPEGIILSRREGYYFDDATTKQWLQPQSTQTLPDNTMILNSEKLAAFFGEYVCTARGKIQLDEGILQKNAHQTISVCLSESLSIGQWAELLNACEKYHTTLHLYVAPNVILPSELKINATPLLSPSVALFSETFFTQHTGYCFSTDPDTTVHAIPDALILDISEISAGDLLHKIKGNFDADALFFHFSNEAGILTTALRNNQTVILTGKMNQSLRQHLMDFLLRRMQDKTPQGKLFIILNEKFDITIIPSFQHAVSVQEKCAALGISALSELGPDALESKALSQLRAIQRYRQVNLSQTPWSGMLSLPSMSPMKIDLDNIAQQANAFNQQRLKQVKTILKHSPFVFLAEISGVGKTMFVHKVWKSKTSALYIGEEQIRAWALDKTPGIKTLFIDEANISSRNWSEFEGLLHKIPFVRSGNAIYTISKSHNVFFAGNPLSYGGDRQLPSLFNRHGNSVVFEPLSAAYIAKEMLLPVLQDSIPETDLRDVLNMILSIPAYLTKVNAHSVLITPRELTMIALLTVRYYRDNPSQKPCDIAAYYAYQLSKHLVPSEYQQEFDRQFSVNPLPRNVALKKIKLVINETNAPVLHAVSDLLALRKMRRESLTQCPVQLYGGLGGITIEGSPGIGKTELVKETLLVHGLTEGEDFSIIPVSMPLSEKENLVLRSLDEGRVVIIDEMNSAPMMERLLNDALMGKSPEGKGPKKAGFTVIATQNPPTMGARNIGSPALRHRMQHIAMPDYQPTEMRDIMLGMGLKKNIAAEIVGEYQLSQHEMNLCFRDLLRVATCEMNKNKSVRFLAPVGCLYSRPAHWFPYRTPSYIAQQTESKPVVPMPFLLKMQYRRIPLRSGFFSNMRFNYLSTQSLLRTRFYI